MRRVVRRAADLLVHLPVGVVLTVAEEAPALTRRGRHELAVAAARLGLRPMPNPLAPRLGDLDPADDGAGATSGPETADVRTDEPVLAASVEGPAPDVADLPIPEYDHLAASQVVQRLRSLDHDDLDLVAAYEAAGRSRTTILRRIDQLREA